MNKVIIMSEKQDLFGTVVGLKNYKGNQVFKLGSI